MSGSQTETTTFATDILNTATQTINNYCSIACSNDISNVNITVVGENTTINLSQTCSAVGAECNIKNLMSSQINNLITNLIQDTQSSEGIFSLLGPSSTESENVSNAIKNAISQLVNNTCNLTSDNVANSINATFLGNDETFNLAQTGNMDKATCVLDTVVKNIISNDVSNTAKNSQSSCGALKYIVIALIIVAIIILLPLIKNLFSGGGSGKGGSVSVETSSQPQAQAAQVQQRPIIYYAPRITQPAPVAPVAQASAPATA